MISLAKSKQQFVRYAMVGIVTNLLGYSAYLLITWWGIEPKKAMTSMYLLGALVGYFGNRKWAFAYKGGVWKSFVRYWGAHLGGYLLNLFLLYFFVDVMGYPHQVVQGIAIFIVAIYLFIMFKYVVFLNIKESKE